LKKYVSLVLVAIVVISGFLFTPTEKAEAATFCDWNYDVRVCGANSSSNAANVWGSVENFSGFDYFYTMQLQRYENGSWNVVGTRTGKVYADWNQYGHTFTNVRANNGKDKLKIYVKLFRDQYHLDYIGAVQSPYFYR
jgi:hypothetical protein